MVSRLIKKSLIASEYYFYRLIFIIAEFCNTTFFYIFLYSQTQDISQIITYEIILFTGMIIGYIFGSFLVEQLGYLGNYKLSFLLLGINQIFLALTLDYVQSLILVFAVISGFARGIYWSSILIVKIKEFGTRERGLLISNTMSIILILNLLFPPLIGAFLSATADYSFIILIGGIILVASIFIPWNYNKRPQSKITKEEIKMLLTNKYFINYGVLIGIKNGIESCLNLIILILPFLFIKDELGVGLLTAVIYGFSIILSHFYRKSKLEQSGKLAKIGNYINSISSALLLIFWNVPGLLIRGLGVTIGSAIKIPAEDKIESKLREVILKEKLNQSIVELNFLTEVFVYLGRFIFLFIFLLISLAIGNIENAIKIIILLASIWGILYATLLLGINKRVKKASTQVEA